MVFEGFDLRQTVEAARTKGAKPNNREPELETRWLDDRPRLAVDRNGIPIILHIPNWHRKKSLVGVCTHFSVSCSDFEAGEIQ